MSDEDSVNKEKYRSQFHFAPRRGWMNDPNGLVYSNGDRKNMVRVVRTGNSRYSIGSFDGMSFHKEGGSFIAAHGRVPTDS